MRLQKLIESVSPLNETAMNAARRRQAQLAKPPGSLGRLEELSIQLAGITGNVHNQIKKKHLLVFAADNGVVSEGVSSAPQSVTLQQTINLTRAKTGASTLCKHFGCDITVCDVGVNATIKDEKVLNRKIAYGTQNIIQGSAMTREQAVQAITTGIELAMETDSDVIDVLSKAGGFDIAAMCGAFIGCAATRRPVVMDGFISAVAALCAYKLCPNSVYYFIPSHASYEIGYQLAMNAMNLECICQTKVDR